MPGNRVKTAALAISVTFAVFAVGTWSVMATMAKPQIVLAKIHYSALPDSAR